MSNINRLVKYILESKEKYSPPYTIEEIKKYYPNSKILSCPIHVWRATTGIELIHVEPEIKEQKRIWKNWNLMTDEMKKISDEKSIELFGITNKEHHNKIMKERYNPKRQSD